jgi:hypothetical protein
VWACSLEFVSILWYSFLKATAQLAAVGKGQGEQGLGSAKWLWDEAASSSDHGIAFAM